MKKIKVLYIEPLEDPRVIEIENTLEAKQELVDGWIEMVCPYNHKDDAVLICNEEGKIRNLPWNRALLDDKGDMYDVVFGAFFVARAPEDSDDFDSLTDEQIKKYTDMYSEMLIPLNAM